MFCVSNFRLCFTSFSFVIAICFSGQLAAQEQPLPDAVDAQQAVAEEVEVQKADPDIDDQPAEPLPCTAI